VKKIEEKEKNGEIEGISPVLSFLFHSLVYFFLKQEAYGCQTT
jgi:hypothetical protein